MLQVLIEVLVPVFLVVSIGFVVAKAVGATPGSLATLSYWVLGPAFIFDILSTADLDPSVVGRVVGATSLIMVVVGALAALLTRLVGGGLSLVAANVMTSIHGNVGNFGLAISAFALGEDVLPIAGIVMVTVNTVGILAGVGLATIREGSALKAVGIAVTSPLALAVVPALAVNASGATVPIWLDRPLSLLAAALIPVMLLTLGIQLAEMRRALPRRMAAIPATLKLALSPLVALVVVGALDLGGVAADVVVLQAAMPAAVFTSLIALEHSLEPDYVTSVVLTGTLISAFTLPLVISLL